MLIATDEEYARRAATRALTYYATDLCDYPGGYVDGKIVNVADIAGTKVWADFIPYSVSKAGLLALTTGLAKALAPAVQVNAIAPGIILLPDGSALDEQARAVERVPLRRLGAPEDIAHAAVYLIESDFVTGEVLTGNELSAPTFVKRLVVLVPEQVIAEGRLAKRIWMLASARRLDAVGHRTRQPTRTRPQRH